MQETWMPCIFCSTQCSRSACKALFPRTGIPLLLSHSSPACALGPFQLSSQLSGSYLIERRLKGHLPSPPQESWGSGHLRWLPSSLLCLLIREHRNVCVCFSPLAQHGCKTGSLCISCMLISVHHQHWGFKPSDRGAQGTEHSFSITQYIFKSE